MGRGSLQHHSAFQALVLSAGPPRYRATSQGTLLALRSHASTRPSSPSSACPSHTQAPIHGLHPCCKHHYAVLASPIERCEPSMWCVFPPSKTLSTSVLACEGGAPPMRHLWTVRPLSTWPLDSPLTAAEPLRTRRHASDRSKSFRHTSLPHAAGSLGVP
jgi:hypothetical protein